MEYSSDVTILEQGKGIHLLITAGSDGDEYDGMEAAKQLIELWRQDSTWQGTRVIIPILNRLGYEVGVSYDPVTNTFPKHSLPRMWDTLPMKPELWIDLHGGSRNESLTPFVWGFPYGTASVRNKTQQILHSLIDTTTVYAPWYKAKQVAELDCVYIVLESGEKGFISTDSVQRHKDWVQHILYAYEHPSTTNKKHIENITYLFSSGYGFWKPCVKKEEQISRSQICGNIYTETQSYTVTSKDFGKVLWHHMGGWVMPGDSIVAVGKI